MAAARAAVEASELAGVAALEEGRFVVLESLAQQQVDALRALLEYFRSTDADALDQSRIDALTANITGLGDAINQVSALSIADIATRLDTIVTVGADDVPKWLSNALGDAADGIGTMLDLILDGGVNPQNAFLTALAADELTRGLELTLDGLAGGDLSEEMAGWLVGENAALSRALSLAIKVGGETDENLTSMILGAGVNLQSDLNLAIGTGTDWKILKALSGTTKLATTLTAVFNRGWEGNLFTKLGREGQADLRTRLLPRFNQRWQRRLMRLIGEAGNNGRVRLDGQIDFDAKSAFRDTLSSEISSPVSAMTSALQDATAAINGLQSGLAAQARAVEDQAEVDRRRQKVSGNLQDALSTADRLLNNVNSRFVFGRGENADPVSATRNDDGTINLPSRASDGLISALSSGTFDQFYGEGGLRDRIGEINSEIRRLSGRDDKIDHRAAMVGMTDFQKRQYAISNQTGIRDALYDFEQRILRQGDRGKNLTDWEQEQYDRLKAIPGFAAGGMHMGGLRIVGERGPELEATGPARYWNAGDTARMMGGSADVAGDARHREPAGR